MIYIPRNIMKEVDRKFSDKRAPLLSGLKSATDKQSSSSSPTAANTSAATSMTSSDSAAAAIERSQKSSRAGQEKQGPVFSEEGDVVQKEDEPAYDPIAEELKA